MFWFRLDVCPSIYRYLRKMFEVSVNKVDFGKTCVYMWYRCVYIWARLVCYVSCWGRVLGTKLGTYTLARKLATVSLSDTLCNDVVPYRSRSWLDWLRFQRPGTLAGKWNPSHPLTISREFWSDRDRNLLTKKTYRFVRKNKENMWVSEKWRSRLGKKCWKTLCFFNNNFKKL